MKFIVLQPFKQISRRIKHLLEKSDLALKTTDKIKIKCQVVFEAHGKGMSYNCVEGFQSLLILFLPINMPIYVCTYVYEHKCVHTCMNICTHMRVHELNMSTRPVLHLLFLVHLTKEHQRRASK